MANTRDYYIKAPLENAIYLAFSVSSPRVSQTCQLEMKEVEVWSSFMILTRWGRCCNWHRAQGERDLWGVRERQTHLTARQEFSPRHHPWGSFIPLCLYCHRICTGQLNILCMGINHATGSVKKSLSFYYACKVLPFCTRRWNLEFSNKEFQAKLERRED